MMEKINVELKSFDELRKRAEDLLSQSVEERQSTGDNDDKKLIHELNVHQIELEMQNNELRRAQIELEESKQKYADLFDLAPVGYLVLDPAGVVLNSNLTGASLLGVERRHLLKKKYSDFIASEFQDAFYLHRKSVSKFQTRQTCELQLKRKGDTPFYASLESITKLDAVGNFLQINTTITDIDTRVSTEEALHKAHDNLEELVEKRTVELVKMNEELRRELKHRKLAEKALLESEQRYRAVVESQTELICRFLPDGSLTFVNDAYSQCFDKKPAELTGQSFLDQVPQEDLEKVEKHLAAINRDHPIATIRHQVKQPDGAIRWQQWIDRAIFDGQGRVKEYQSVGRDITEQVQAEEALNEAQKDLERRVEERTIELRTAAKKLKTKQKELVRHKAKLELVNKDLLETNRAVTVLARNIDKHKRNSESRFAKTISSKILPLVEDLKKAKTLDSVLLGLDFLTANLQDLSNDLTGQMNLLASLTPTELRVASMIKKGLPTRKIADKLFVSLHTVKSHRRNIRKKLNIQNSAINLESYLRSTMW